jgi:nicotinate-nucleotide adenylyltransferase
MRIGVFGGTFDPPHMGHLVVAQEVHHRLGLDRLLWVPAAVPPHKRGQRITPAALRLEMTRATIADDDRFELCDLEINRQGPSYTVDTLRALRAGSPDDETFLILGADQLTELATWREPDEVRRLATIVGFARAGESPPTVDGVLIVPVPRIDLSSTDVRRRIAAHEPVTYLVPASVERAIRRHGLYRMDEP